MDAIEQTAPSSGEAGATGSCTPSTKAASSQDAGDAPLSDRVPVLLLYAQLALLVLLAHRFRIEDAGFRHLLLLTLAGFLLHALLPERLRLPFFLLLSLAGIALVLGPVNGAWVVGIGVVLFSICHLPWALPVRIGTLLVVAVLLAAVRSRAVDLSVPAAIWPIPGSMFMFRLILYLYSLRHGLGSRSWTKGLAYFFLLPNVCFPLFPVVDYTTFERTYAVGDRLRIAQNGVRWMGHGIVHLLLYRLVSYHFAVGPEDVVSGPQLASFMLTNFLLYLRVSGQFHVVIGMLQLFGFNLPRANHHYLLASGFSDFWRRINIYWKDFMLKAVYYPAFFRLKHLGPVVAMSCSIVIVFVATWLLHAYQWFWLLGSFRLSWQDGTYWGLLAILVLAASRFEGRRSAAARPKTVTEALRAVAWHGTRITGTLATMCVLWSLWTAESLSQWIGMWVRAAADPLGSLSVWTALLSVAVVGLLAGLTAEKRLTGVQRSLSAGVWWESPANGSSALVTLLLLCSIPTFTLPLGARTAELMESLRDAHLSDRDQALLTSGYYERILGGARANPQVRQVLAADQSGTRDFFGTPLARTGGGFLTRELVPSSRGNFLGAPVEVNSMGMRDREYWRQKPTDTVRIAVLGASATMGWGVGNEETFENLLEVRLNRGSGDGGAQSYEVLNFAVAAYTEIEQVWVLDNRAMRFAPDMMLIVSTSRSVDPVRRLAEKIQWDVPLLYPALINIREQLPFLADGIESIANQLEPYRGRLMNWTYERLARRSRIRGVLPVAVLLPGPRERSWPERMLLRADMLGEQGFEVLDLLGVYDTQKTEDLVIMEYDNHPSAHGHRLIADSLFEALRGNRQTSAIIWGDGATDGGS